MNKLKARFNEDPAFAITVIAIGASSAALLMKSAAKLIESSAYAYRASKI
jgi:hypothetical protein